MIEVFAGCDKKIFPDGIIVYHITASSRPVVNAWYQDVVTTFQQAIDQNKPAHLCYDIREISFFTPYVMKRAGDLGKVPLPPDWRVATVVKSAFARQIIDTIKTISLLSKDMYERSHVFDDYEEALTWLRRP